MPKQVLFGEDGFKYLHHNLTRRGFRLTEHFETRMAIDRLGLVPTRPFKPRTAVFELTANGLTVKVRTTYNQAAKSAIQSTNGWVMITDGDIRRYTDRPFNRTENFLESLLESAAIARQRVLHRPNCPTCMAAMNIVRGRHLKQVYWRCLNHRRISMGWDDPLKGIPEAAELLKRIKRRRKRHAQTDARTRAKGKRPHQKMLARAKNPPWLVTRPENMLRAGPVRR